MHLVFFMCDTMYIDEVALPTARRAQNFSLHMLFARLGSKFVPLIAWSPAQLSFG